MVPCPGCQRPIFPRLAYFCPVCLYQSFGVQVDQLAPAILASVLPSLTQEDSRSLVVMALRTFGRTVESIAINHPAPDVPLTGQVRAYKAMLSPLKAAIHQYREAVSTGAPAGEFVVLLAHAIQQRQTSLSRVLAPKPTTAYLLDTLTYQRFDRVLWAGLHAYVTATQARNAPQAILQAAVLAMRQALFEGLALDLLALVDECLPEGQGRALVQLAAWVALHLSLREIRQDGKVYGNRLSIAFCKELQARGDA